MLEKTANEKQSEKILYFTNAFLNLSKYQEIDIDIQGLVELSRGNFYYYMNPNVSQQIDTKPNNLGQ